MTREQWLAIQRRDSSWDGRLYYAVKASRTVCRPSCTARSCEPEDVVVFDSLEEALQRGYHPCSRCRPDRPDWRGSKQKLVECSKRYIRAHYQEKFSLDVLSSALFVNKVYLSKVFKQSEGITLLKYYKDNLRYVVVLVYHNASLHRCLSQREPMRWLDALGYSGQSLEDKLERLGNRFQKDSFPHEIGLFLGYPPEDVRGFIANKGKNSKYTGEWKVYGDLSKALTLFRSYSDSRSWVMEQARKGMNLEAILKVC